MRWVESAVTRPSRCAVIPYVTQGPFIDTGQDLDLEHVYISLPAAEHIAGEMLGWTPPQTLAHVREENEGLKVQLEQLQAQVEEADRFAEAAEYTLSKFDTKVRKKPGRKPQKKDKEEVPV